MRTGASRSGFLSMSILVVVVSLPEKTAVGDDPPHYVKKGTWEESMLASRELLSKQENQAGRGASLPNFGESDFSVALWIKTNAQGGAIIATAPAEGEWAPQGKALFLRRGALAFDVGWVGALGSDTAVNDGAWHHVALVGRDPLEFYVDGTLVERGRLGLASDPRGHVVKLGYCADNFPQPSGFQGFMDEVCMYSRRLSSAEISRIRDGETVGDRGLVGYWRFDTDATDSSGNGNHGTIRGAASATGKRGRALRFNGKDAVILPPSTIDAVKAELWTLLARDFTDAESRKEMLRERHHKIWDREWRPGDLGELASRYVQACEEGEQRATAAQLAREVDSVQDLWKVRAAFYAPPRLRLPEPIPLDRDPHLVGWWRLDQESGTTAKDASQHGRNGTLAGGLSFDENAVRGRFGWALRFDGGDGVVEISGYKGVTGTRPRTVAAWIKTKNSRGEILSWGQSDFGKMWTFGFVRGRVGVTPNGGYLYVKDALHDGAWHHVAAVMEEAEAPNLYDHVKLYQDGEPAVIHDIGLLDLWPLETGGELDLRIGRRFNGLIDDVRVFDRALSEEEIQALFNVKSKSK